MKLCLFLPGAMMASPFAALARDDSTRNQRKRAKAHLYLKGNPCVLTF